MNGVNNIKFMVDNGNEARDVVGVSWVGRNGDREWVRVRLNGLKARLRQKHPLVRVQLVGLVAAE